MNWFETNPKFANPDKFQAIIVHHNKNTNENYTLKVNNIEIEPKKAANQLHATCKLQNQMGKKEKEILRNSFIYSNFNFCPFVWHCSSKNLMRKIEDSGEISAIILDNYESEYDDALLHTSGKSTMKVNRLRTLAIEIFQTLNDKILVR